MYNLPCACTVLDSFHRPAQSADPLLFKCEQSALLESFFAVRKVTAKRELYSSVRAADQQRLFKV